MSSAYETSNKIEFKYKNDVTFYQNILFCGTWQRRTENGNGGMYVEVYVSTVQHIGRYLANLSEWKY